MHREKKVTDARNQWVVQWVALGVGMGCEIIGCSIDSLAGMLASLEYATSLYGESGTLQFHTFAANTSRRGSFYSAF
jgi:hypothetical protein